MFENFHVCNTQAIFDWITQIFYVNTSVVFIKPQKPQNFSPLKLFR